MLIAIPKYCGILKFASYKISNNKITNKSSQYVEAIYKQKSPKASKKTDGKKK